LRERYIFEEFGSFLLKLEEFNFLLDEVSVEVKTEVKNGVLREGLNEPECEIREFLSIF
jgi:hypothetical protein